MVYAIKVKKEIQKEIERKVNIGEKINMDKILSAMELDTGLTKKAIMNILHNMHNLEIIKIKDGTISKGEK